MIKFRKVSCCALLLCAAFSFGVPARAQEPDAAATNAPYDLNECYALALRQSEALKIRSENIQVALAQYEQAIRQLYPQFDLNLRQNVRDNADFGRVTRGSSAVEDASNSTGGRSGSIGRSQFDATFSLEQPIFRGFREFLLADAAELDAKAQRHEFTHDKELLYLDVADLFYQIVSAGRQLDVLAKAEDILSKRVNELKGFTDLGKSRESEVLQARSELEELRVVSEQTRGAQAAAKELMAFLTGIPADQLAFEPTVGQAAVQPLENYLAPISGRSDLQASQTRVEAQSKRLEAVGRERWPTIDALANAYPFEDPERNREWDIFIGLTLPIFEGGRIQARSDEESAQLRILELEKQERLRVIEREVRVAYQRVKTSQNELSRLVKLREVSEKNYRLQIEDYGFGVVTNLDVLQAIRQLQETERRRVAAEEQLRALTAELEVRSGNLPL